MTEQPGVKQIFGESGEIIAVLPEGDSVLQGIQQSFQSFDYEDTKPVAPPPTGQTATLQGLSQAQMAQRQAEEQLLNEKQHLEQAQQQLYLAQENVKKEQQDVQLAQQRLMQAQATVIAYRDSLR